MTFVVEFASQATLFVAPVQSWVFAAIPLEPVCFQSRHGVRHHLVVPEEYERAATSLATEPMDFRPLPSDVARRSNDGSAVLPLDLAALPIRIKVRPDALAQILDREGVVALTIKYRYELSFDSAETPSHKRYSTEQFFRMQTLKDVAAAAGWSRVLEDSPTSIFGPVSSPF